MTDTHTPATDTRGGNLKRWSDVPDNVRAKIIAAAFAGLGRTEDHPGALEWYEAIRAHEDALTRDPLPAEGVRIDLTEFPPIHLNGEPRESGYERAALKRQLKINPYAVAQTLSIIAKNAPPMGSHAGNLWAMYEWVVHIVDRLKDARPVPDTRDAALGRFGHHPNPADDFCVEVTELMAIATDRHLGVSNPDDRSLEGRILRAMEFRVGGDMNCVDAKRELRALDAIYCVSQSPAAPEAREYGGEKFYSCEDCGEKTNERFCSKCGIKPVTTPADEAVSDAGLDATKLTQFLGRLLRWARTGGIEVGDFRRFILADDRDLPEWLAGEIPQNAGAYITPDKLIEWIIRASRSAQP